MFQILVNRMSLFDVDTSGTEKWIEVVLKELKKATTNEIVERVSMFNEDCADRIPMVLTQMRVAGKVTYNIVQSENSERKELVWQLMTDDE